MRRLVLISCLFGAMFLMHCSEGGFIIKDIEAYRPEDSTYQALSSASTAKFDTEPSVLKRTDGRYPAAALQKGVTGEAWIEMWVDEKGNVRKALVMKSTDPIFNEPSLRAAMLWRFSPALVDSKPVPFRIAQLFKYYFRTPK